MKNYLLKKNVILFAKAKLFKTQKNTLTNNLKIY